MESIGAIFFAGFLLVLMFIKVPIGFAIGIVSMLTFFHYDIPTQILAQKFYTGMSSFTWVSIPLFILAGTIMAKGGLSERIVRFAESLIGRIRGGLGITAIFSSAFFAAISGSSPATAAAIGSLMMPAMEKRNYPEKLAAAIVASGGVLGVLIPPSIILIAYGVLAEVSITKLFIGAMIPGLLLAAVMMVVTFFMARETTPTSEPFSVRQIGKTFSQGFLSLMAPVVILGGIYLGIFTPTESAVIAVVYGTIIGFIYRELNFADLSEAVKMAVIVTGSLAILWAAAASYSYALTLSGLTQSVAQSIINVSSDPIVILLLISVLVIVLGCFINAMGMIILLTPIFVPIIQAVQFDLVAFGIIFTIMCEIGFITPPVGTNLFVVKSLCKDADILEISIMVLPYIAALYVVVLVCIFFPGLILFLPNAIM
jgi:C4-dicarboxylate transporter DctM subunit